MAPPTALPGEDSRTPAAPTREFPTARRGRTYVPLRRHTSRSPAFQPFTPTPFHLARTGSALDPRDARSFSKRPGAWSEPRKSGAGTPQPTAELQRPTRETLPRVVERRRSAPAT